MDVGLAIGAIGIVLTLASFGYAIVVTERSKQIKALCYDILEPVAIADAVSKESGNSIRLVYERTGTPEEVVNSVYAQYLRFTNLGKVPIAEADSAKADRLRVEIVGGKVLDVSLAQVTRDVCNIRLSPTVFENGKYVASIGYDFLDSMDGALVQIISESKESKARLAGTIVGMPDGIKRAKDENRGGEITGLGCMVPICIFLAGLGAVAWLYHKVEGSWQHIWLLAMPFAAFVPTIGLMIPFMSLYTKRGTVKFPEHLSPPKWYFARMHVYERPPYRERETDKEKN